MLDKHPVDILVDFSAQDGIYVYGKSAAKRQVKIFSAISQNTKKNWICLRKQLYFGPPSITLGVNHLLFSAKFLQQTPGVDIGIIEEHFKQKEGISGTAVKIAHALDLDVSNINSVRAGELWVNMNSYLASPIKQEG